MQYLNHFGHFNDGQYRGMTVTEEPSERHEWKKTSAGKEDANLEELLMGLLALGKEVLLVLKIALAILVINCVVCVVGVMKN